MVLAAGHWLLVGDENMTKLTDIYLKDFAGFVSLTHNLTLNRNQKILCDFRD